MDPRALAVDVERESHRAPGAVLPLDRSVHGRLHHSRASQRERLRPRDVSQHLRVHAHALAQVLERAALVVDVDPLRLALPHAASAKAVAAHASTPEYTVV